MASRGRGPTSHEFAASAREGRCYKRRQVMHSSRITRLFAAAVILAAAPARADDDAGDGDSDARTEPAPRRHDASWREILAGPFQTSRLFAMPTAEVVGAFQVSLSGDASLLSESDVLSSSSVVAIGFGDIAQLEYRNSAAISALDDQPIRVPTLGVQLKLPLRQRKYVPGFAVALRFGFPRQETSGHISHDENVTDLYAVGRLLLWGPLRAVTLHGGLRVAAAEIDSEGEPMLDDVERNLFLPAGGWEWQVGPRTVLAGELSLVPLFDPGDATRASRIKSGVFGRAGVRWRVLPALVIDASVGYRIEVARLDGSAEGSFGPNSLVDWDIRLGGEIFFPWGAVACRTAGVFCE